ncbi:hypothetical protein KSX_24810 [Ktedonospora formicarum]|uniref:Uncharacterized protein n=1 Tax=Ktedonospora formicarum TaxID=2778364 RepID=A0A8J3I0B2_9CHLR|nr:hypothetical protein KSX_24810 [Ktedonospora formicarum]
MAWKITLRLHFPGEKKFSPSYLKSTPGTYCACGHTEQAAYMKTNAIVMASINTLGFSNRRKQESILQDTKCNVTIQ